MAPASRCGLARSFRPRGLEHAVTRIASFTDERDALVARLVESGRYASAIEVVRGGLRLLQREEDARLLEKWLAGGPSPEERGRRSPGLLDGAREVLQTKTREGLDAARRGGFVDGDVRFARLLARLEADAAAESNADGKTRRP